MKMKKAAIAIAVAASMAAGTGTVIPPIAVFAANNENNSNDTSLTDALNDSDIIDMDKKGKLTIYKYDLTAAEAAGKYTQGELKATGQENRLVKSMLEPFAVKGVDFTYLRVGNIEQYSEKGKVKVVYEIPEELRRILDLDKNDINMKDLTYLDEAGTEVPACSNEEYQTSDGKIYHYTSQMIDEALQKILKEDNVAAKNELEAYLHTYSKQDAEKDDEDPRKNDGFRHGTITTDENGYAYAKNLELGLYLVVETKVPDQVTDTVNPWFASIPYTNTYYDGSPDNSDEYGAGHKEDGTNYPDTAGGNQAGGEKWMYEAFFYPKNQTGNPTLDKSVRNAYSNNADSREGYKDKNQTVQNNGDYKGTSDSDSLITFNAMNENGNKEKNWPSKLDFPSKLDANSLLYVACRGGYTLGDGRIAGYAGDFGIGTQNAIARTKTDSGYDVFSTDYEYRDTTTASEGDLLDFVLVSKLPHITSSATYLSEYTFTDEMEEGLTYSDDFKVAFYDNKEDAMSNNTVKAVEIWSGAEDGDKEIDYRKETAKLVEKGTAENQSTDGFLTVYTKNREGTNGRVLQLTEEGLKRINSGKKIVDENGKEKRDSKGFSDYYMVVYYTAQVDSSDKITLGDKGNQNNASLLWSRTKNEYFEVLQDRNYVYSYGLNLTKLFSGTDNHSNETESDQGDFSKVQFRLYNRTDGYYVIASKTADGVYEVNGKTKTKGKGTVFVPGSTAKKKSERGKLLIRGLEADTYQLTEISTDDGYSLLKDDIDIVITATDRDVKASVEGVTGMSEDYAGEKVIEIPNRIIENYGRHTEYDTKTGKKRSTENESGSREDSNSSSDTSSDTSKGVKNEDEQPVNDTKEISVKGGKGEAYKDDDSTGNQSYKKEKPNGDTIGATDMYVGDIHPASATVDNRDADMTANHKLVRSNKTESRNSAVEIEVTNTKGFHLPDTGGNGLYLFTIAGAAAAAIGVTVTNKKRKDDAA